MDFQVNIDISIYCSLNENMKNNGLKVQLIANAGLLIEVASDSDGEAFLIGIDCFCRDPKQIYQDTTSEEKHFLMERIRQKQLNTLIFTHEHEDHFCALDVWEAWQENPQLQIISNHAVTLILISLGIPQKNLITIGGNPGTMVSWIRIKKIRLGCMITRHDGKGYEKVKNITILIEGMSERIVVTGDAMPCVELFERLCKWAAQIDHIYLPFSYVGLPSVRKQMKQYLNVSFVHVLHCPRPEADLEHWAEAARNVCEQDAAGFPDIYW